MMVLEKALCNLRDELMSSGYFNRIYEYAELLPKDGDKKYPQVYLGNGSYKAIYDFDVNGSGYFRKVGDVHYEYPAQVQTRACSDSNPMIDVVVPMRLVAAVPKKKLADNGFSDELLVFELVGYIGKRQTAIQNVQSVHGVMRSSTTDRDIIWSNEVKGIDKTVDLTLSFVSIQFDLKLRMQLDCINQNCDY